MNPLLTLVDIDTARARIVATGAKPKTFVCGPAKDANWSKLSFYVGADIDGRYTIGQGATLDDAVTNLLSQGVSAPAGHEQLRLEGVA